MMKPSPSSSEQLAANQARRNTFNRLPEDEKEVYDQLGFREKLDAVDEGIRRYSLPVSVGFR